MTLGKKIVNSSQWFCDMHIKQYYDTQGNFNFLKLFFQLWWEFLK